MSQAPHKSKFLYIYLTFLSISTFVAADRVIDISNNGLATPSNILMKCSFLGLIFSSCRYLNYLVIVTQEITSIETTCLHYRVLINSICDTQTATFGSMHFLENAFRRHKAHLICHANRKLIDIPVCMKK